MKPLVIYVDDTHDIITLTKKQFEDYLKQAYDQGYSDNNHYYYNNSPYITWTGTPSWSTITTNNTTITDNNCAQTAINTSAPSTSI